MKSARSQHIQLALAQVENQRDEIIQLLRELIRIPTVNTGIPPTGHESAACRLLQNWLGDIESEILEAEPDRGNFCARLSGNDAGKTLLFMSHLDVVPPGDESTWRHPPFSAIIEDHRIYGRGAIDCKTLVAAQAAAIKILHDLNMPLAGNLKFIAAADEETGGALGFGFLATQHPEQLQADLAINEGGGRPVKTHDNQQAWLTGTGEKGRYQVEFTIHGKATHASDPASGDNPIARLPELLQRISEYNPPPDDSIATLQYLPVLTGRTVPSGKFKLDELLKEIETEQPDLARQLRTGSHWTLVPTRIESGHKTNMIPDRCHIICDARTPPAGSKQQLEKNIQALIDDLNAIELNIHETAAASASQWNSQKQSLFQNALSHALNGAPVLCVPSTCGGFTDSRFVRPLGIPTFGFQPKHPDTDPNRNDIHCANEAAWTEDLLFATRTLCALAIEFLS